MDAGTKTRTGLTTMIDYIKKNKVDFIYLYGLERLSRDFQKALALIEQMKETGATFPAFSALNR